MAQPIIHTSPPHPNSAPQAGTTDLLQSAGTDDPPRCFDCGGYHEPDYDCRQSWIHDLADSRDTGRSRQ